MNPHFPPSGLVKSDVPSTPESALELKTPRIVVQLCGLWGHPGVEAYIASLLMDSRDGDRQGFPMDAAQELLFLMDISIAKRAIVAAQSTGMSYRQVYQSMRNNADEAAQDPKLAWHDPNTSNDARSTSAHPNNSSAPNKQAERPSAPVRARPPPKKKSLFKRLFG